MSRSPFSYCIFASSVAQSVSRSDERFETGSFEKMPIQRKPEMMRSSSSADGNVVLALMAAMSDASSAAEAPRARFVTSAHGSAWAPLAR